MRGFITDRDVLANLRIVLTEFGPRCVLRWLLAVVMRKRTTFLDVAVGYRYTH